ncbi:tetratricopeptide repeat protein [Flavobacterium chungnamense]|uniref:Tetratricopeptide repeat protein n=1 Tax=Flavobacterium chungnamense TaxID=706182 RepID=A0ABP7UWL7_9FLAO
MKIKQIIIASTLLVSVASFSQKEELKALKKLYAKEVLKGEDLVEYKNLVTKVAPLAIEEGDKVYSEFYKSMIPILDMNALAQDVTLTPLQVQMKMAKAVTPKTISELSKGLNATLEYEKKVGKKIQTDDINETITAFKPTLLNYAIYLGNEKKQKEASEVLYAIYQLDKKDTDNLYYAANYAVNGQDYENSLKYYRELKSINYSGEKTLYIAKNKVTGQEENYTKKEDRDNLVKLGTHINPKEEKEPSKKGEITKNIALILVELDRKDEAKAALADARKENPDDVNLITYEADIYLKMNDTENYKRLINEALEKSPNDKVLLFNLGVTSGNANQLEDAEKYYKRVIEIDPKYTDAYLNLSDIILKPDAKIVKDMNNLGVSAKDQKQYEVLKSERQKLFNKAMPVLEKAYELDPTNEIVKSNLKSVYSFLELNDKIKAMN